MEYADRENSCFNNRLPPPLMEVNSSPDSSASRAAAAGCSNSMTVGRPYQVISGADTTGVEYKCGRRSLSLSLVLSRVDDDDDDDVAPFLLE